MLDIGDTAPDFELPGTEGGEVRPYRLGDYTDGGIAVLAFYVFDFHPSCTEEVCTIRDRQWFDPYPDTHVFGIPTDRAFSHRTYLLDHLSFSFVWRHADTGELIYDEG